MQTPKTHRNSKRDVTQTPTRIGEEKIESSTLHITNNGAAYTETQN